MGPGPVPFFMEIGEEIGGGATMDVTPAQVEGGAGDEFDNNLSMSFSGRKRLELKFKIWRPVALSSRTVGGPSIMVMRCLLYSSCRISSRKGA